MFNRCGYAVYVRLVLHAGTKRSALCSKRHLLPSLSVALGLDGGELVDHGGTALVDGPVLLRRQLDARAIRAAAEVGLTKCDGGGPRRRDQLLVRQTTTQNLLLDA